MQLHLKKQIQVPDRMESLLEAEIARCREHEAEMRHLRYILE